MAILGSILIWTGIALFAIFGIGIVFFLGLMIGRAGTKPKQGYTGFTSMVRKEIYDELLDKGAYKSEQDMLQDALSLLNWGLEHSIQGRYITHCEPDGSNATEVGLETFQSLRAMFNPIMHLERCFGLDTPEDNE